MIPRDRLFQRDLVLPAGSEVIGVSDRPARRHGVPDPDRFLVPGPFQVHERVAVALPSWLDRMLSHLSIEPAAEPPRPEPCPRARQATHSLP